MSRARRDTPDYNRAVRFRFFRLRFHFDALGALQFPAGKPGNIIRGAFGSIFRKIACVPECVDAHTCERRAICAYARTFEPASLGDSPSGLSDWPRPFVFRARHLDARTIPAGSRFHFDVNLFQLRDPPIEYFVLAFARLAEEGLGPGRGRAALAAVDQIDPDGRPVWRLFDGQTLSGPAGMAPSEVTLERLSAPARRVEVRFLSPTELKHRHQLAQQPEFGVLMARIRDRLSTLSQLYGDGPLEMDFAEFGRRAQRVKMTRCELAGVEVSRLSARTGQRHPLGGFVGFAEYEGELAEFIPFLEAAQYSGVGRHTTWGKGEIQVPP